MYSWLRCRNNDIQQPYKNIDNKHTTHIIPNQSRDHSMTKAEKKKKVVYLITLEESRGLLHSQKNLWVPLQSVYNKKIKVSSVIGNKTGSQV